MKNTTLPGYTILKKWFFFLVLLLSMQSGWGQVYQEDFGNNVTVAVPYTSGTNATGSVVKNTNLSNPSWNQNLASANFTGNTLGCMSATTGTSAYTITCTFTVANGYILTPTSIGFDNRGTTTGPNALTITISGSGGTTSCSPIPTRTGAFTTTTATSFASTTLNLTGTITLTFAFTGGASGSTERLDNIILNGTVSAAGSTVTFNSNGGTGTMANQTASSSTALTANSFTRTGYTFSNWNTAANGSGTAYANSASYPFTTSATLYAQWTLNLAATKSQTNIACNGSSNGTATVNATGGVPGYTYAWSPSGGTAATATGLAAGTYSCTITDTAGSSITKTFTITQPTAVTVTPSSQTNVSCNGIANGAATVNASGGTPGYTYSWSPSGGTTSTATGLTPGTYTVTVTDANACTATQTFTITQPPTAVTVTQASQTNVSCNGLANGVVTISDPIFWTEDFGIGFNQAGLASGYTGANGAWTVTNTGFNSASGNQWFISATEAGVGIGNCANNFLINNSGLTNRTLHIGNVSTSPLASIFCPTGDCGAYYDGGASNVTSDIRTESPVIDCSGKSDIILNFNYIEGGQTTIDDATLWYFDGISWSLIDNMPKTYLCNSGQAKWGSRTILLPASANNNPSIKIGFRWVNDSDNVGSDPSFAADDIKLSVGGGTPGYTYSWSPSGGTTSTATGLTAGTYTVTVTDANACTATQTYTITQPTAVSAPTGPASQAFCGSATVASLSATGSSIQWYAAATGGTALASSTALTTATYYVSQTSNSCESARTSVAVNINPLPTITLGFVDDVLPTDTSFTIPFTATSGSPNQYSLTTAATGGSSIVMPNFTPVSNATLGSTPITVTIPASAAAEYGFNLTVTNSTTGCSQVYPFQFHVTSVSHGAIAADQTICSGATPAPLTSTTPGSSSYGSIAYTWEQSTTSVSTGYSTISGETGEGYTPGALTQTTFFKRVTHYAGTNPDVTSDSDPVTITVNTSVGGSVGGSTAICSGSTSGVLTLSGHSGSIVRWESAVSPFTSWTTISNTATTYTSGALTETTKFRAVVNNNSCGEVNATPATISISTTTYDGTSWSNGDPDSTKAAIISGDYTIAADFNACSLQVTNNAAVTVSSTKNVYLNGAITVDSGSSFTMNNNSNLFQADASAVNTGNIIVKRNTSTIVRLDHTLWSSPVTGQNLFSFSPNTLVNRFYVYNTATNSYVTTGLSNTSLFTPAKGFAVRAPNNQSATTPAVWTGTFTGVPNNGTKTFTLATDASNGYHYNLVGNPYPSAISASDFYSANSSKIGGTLYFYAHTLSMNASGVFPTGTNYATWTLLGGAAATAGDGHTSAVAPNGIIQVGQGFIVKATAAGDVTFTNAMRVANQQNQFMKAATTTAETHRMWLNLKTDTGVDINQILVGYMDGATQGVDADLDGLSFGNTGSYLYSKIENNNYVIQARSLPFDTTDEVPLGFNCATAGSYSISLTNTDGLFAASQDVLVRDNLTGTDTSIKTTPYTFTSEAGVFDTRFKLVYQQALGVPSTNFTENSVIVYKNTDWFHVTTKGIEMKDIMVYDISGRLIYSQKDINATTTVLNGLSTTNQVLMLKITSQEGKTVTIKVIN
ncbi:MAG: hypothetical protein RIQ59_758 [Bacteroidota bacterium]|jgi:hypothetical protein